MKEKVKDLWKKHKNKILLGGVFLGGLVLGSIIKIKEKSKMLPQIDPDYSGTIEEALEKFNALKQTSEHPVLFYDGEFSKEPAFGIYDETILLK